MKHTQTLLLALPLAALLAGCGGHKSSKNKSTAAPATSNTPPATGPSTITGSIAPVTSARLELYEIDAGTRGLKLAGVANVGPDGKFSVVTKGVGPFLLLTRGGGIVDPASGQPAALGSAPTDPQSLDVNREQTLEALIAEGVGGAVTVNLSPLTTFASRRIVELLRSDPKALEPANVDAVHLDVAKEHGLVGAAGPVDPRTIEPIVITDAANATTIKNAPDAPEALLGVILAALSQEAQTLGLANSTELVEALAQDYADGTFDGAKPEAPGAAVEIRLAGTPLAADAGVVELAVAARRFLDSNPHNRSGLQANAFGPLLGALGSVNVAPATNHAPRFDPLPDMPATVGVQVSFPLNRLLTGPSSEASQQITSVIATSSDTGIVGNPSVTGSGITRTLTLTPSGAGLATITVVALDNGGTKDGGFEKLTRTFALSVTPPPFVNTAPSFDLVPDQTLDEDATPPALTLANVSANDTNQTVTITATSSDPALLPNPGVSGTGATRTLTLAPTADLFGTATVTITAQDNGGVANNGVDTYTQTFLVTVQSVNDAPTFAAITSQTVASTAPVTTVSVSGISAGPANETQTVTLTATSSDPTLLPNPTVTLNGATAELSLAPTGTNGTVTITITAVDPDGTANGGVDTFSRTFGVNLVTPGPTSVTAVSPRAASAAGGTWVRVETSGFLEDFTTATPTVTVGGQAASVQATPSASTLIVVVPTALPTGTASIDITTNTSTASVTSLEVVAPVAAGDVMINEFFADPSDPNGVVLDANNDGTGNSSEDEFVEIVNLRTTPVDLTDYRVWDGVAERHLFPNPTIVPAGGSIVVFGGGTPTGFAVLHANGHAQTASSGMLGLNNGGDRIEIQQPFPSTTIVAQHAYTTAPDGKSSNREVDGDASAAFVEHALAGTAAGQTNAVGDASPGKRVDGSDFPSTVVTTPNNAPSFDAVAAQMIDEDAAAATVSLQNVSANDANQTVTVTAISSDTSILANPTVSGSGTSWTLNLAPVADAVGTVDVTVTVQDNGGTANGGVDTFSRTFQVTIAAVNDAPTLDAIANQSVATTAGVTSVSLSGISGGPANEGQTVTVTATSGDPTIVPNPTVTFSGATGELSFAPLGVAGTATITVTVQDTDGTANGGVDTFSRTFDVTVGGGGGGTASIGAVSPQLASAAGGTYVTVSTSGFSEDFMTTAPTVTIGGQAVSIHDTPDASTVVVVAPVISASTVAIEVTTPTAQATFSTFEVVPAVSTGEVVINEFLADPSPTGQPAVDANRDGTGDGSQDEYVEIVNLRTTAVDLTDFQIKDGVTVRHVFGNPTTLPPGGVIVVFGGGTPTGFAALHSSGHAQVATTGLLGLNNGGDTIEVLQPWPSTTIVASVTYTSSVGGVSANREVDGDASASWVQHTAAGTTAGTTNAVGNLSPGKKVDGSAFGSGGGGGGGGGTPNQAPSFDALADLALNEDAAAQSVSVANVAANDLNQTVTVTATSSDPSLVANPTVTGSGASWSLSFAPAADASGTATITVTATDDGGTANGGVDTYSRTFQVVVSPVNDAPSFDAIADQTVANTAGVTSVSLSGIAVGPVNESAQTLTLTATSSDPAIVPNPTVVVNGASGDLSFAPLAGASGTVTITVTAQDNGGTANSGVDSFSRTFQITVQSTGPVATVSAVTPPAASRWGGTKLTISTTGFSENFNVTQPTVTIGGQAATIASVHTGNVLVVDTPALTVGAAAVVVTSPTGTATFNGFQVVAPLATGDMLVNEFLADPRGATTTLDANGDGTPDSSQDEFVEFVNMRSTPIDLSGYRIKDSAMERHVFPNPTVVPAGGSIVVFGGGTPTNFAPIHQNGHAMIASSGGLGLSNGSDTIEVLEPGTTTNVILTQAYSAAPNGKSANRLVDADATAAFIEHDQAGTASGQHNAVGSASPGKMVDGSAFSASGGGGGGTTTPTVSSANPALASSAGGTRITVTTTGFVESFSTIQPTVTIGGQPATISQVLSPTTLVISVPAQTAGATTLVVTTPTGTAQIAFTIVAAAASGDLMINEFMADPNDRTGTGIVDANGDGVANASQDEFVEILNKRGTAVDLSGLELKDGWGVRHTFPNPTILPAGGSIVVFGGGTPTGFSGAGQSGQAQVASTGLLGLNNGGDTIELQAPSATTTATVLSTVTYTGTVVTGGVSTNRTVDGDGSSAFVTHSSASTSGGGTATGNFSPGKQANGVVFP